MANRPIFVPIISGNTPGVKRVNVDFKWFAGMAKSQKQKSICSLHEAANQQNISPILEISSKSEDDLGVSLSAFNLMITTIKNNKFSIETAFQSSKVFEHGGPYVDLLTGSSIQAKKDIRLHESGNLVKFVFFNQKFPLLPRTFFYDWLYIQALHQHPDYCEEIVQFNGFTDIEFNQKKSINCQAYSAALYVSMTKLGCLENALSSPDSFKTALATEYKLKDQNIQIQGSLF